MKSKKILSLATATALILSLFCNIPAFISAEPTDGCYIDFSQYKFEPLTTEIYNSYKEENPDKTPTAGNMYDVNIYDGSKVGTYSMAEDNEASGGKYLNYVKDAGGKNGRLESYMFVANPTGNYATNDSDKHIVLAEDTTYSMTIRYRITDLSDGYNLNLFTFASSGVATPNNTQNWQDRVNVKLGLGNTGGWTEETYSFKTPQTYTGDAPHSLLVGFEPRVNGNTARPTEGTALTYNLSVDYIEIKKSVAPQHMEIDFDNYNISKVVGNSGSIAASDDALWVIGEADGNKYMSYPSTGTMTSESSLPYGFMANPTGSGSFADRKNAFILENGAEYRISFKYRLSELAQGGTLTFKVGATAGSNCMNGWSAANPSIALNPLEGTESVKLSASEEWKTVSYTFIMSTTNTSTTDIRRSMQVAFLPNWNQRQVAYTLDVDDIAVDRISSVTIVDEAGNKTVQKGAPATPADGRIGFGGNTAESVVFDTSVNTEIYTRPTAECVERTEYYYDSAMTRPITSMNFSVSDETVYSKKIFKQSSVNQVAFCGFDEYGLRSTGTEYGQFGKYGYINTEKESVWEIVDGVSYTGTKSMHMALSNDYNSARKFLYIGNSYEYEDNVSYHVSLRIKKDTSVEQSGNLKITLGGGGDVYGRFISGGVNSVITIPANELSDEWTEYTIPITFVPQTMETHPDYNADYYRGPALKFDTDSNVAVYIDTITISTVCGSVSGELTDSDRELRVTSSYFDNGNNKIVLAGTEYDIVERGILAKSSTNTAVLKEGGEGVLSVKKTDSFDDYWADGENGEKIFSMLIENIDDRSVTARAYVKLSDGRTYYSPEAVITAAQNAPAGYSLVWGDEFDGSKLDSSKWVAAGTDSYDSTNSLVYYNNNGKNVSVENGMLKLRLEHRGESNYAYKYNAPAGLSTTGTMNFKYGFIEMRAKIPYKNGIQSSFWFKSDASVSEAEKKSDTAAEIDMVETFGLTDTVTPNIHKWYTANDIIEHSQYNSDGRTAQTHKFENCSADEFHIYGMEWTETEIIMYIDDTEYARYDITKAYEAPGKEIGSMDAFKDPMRIIIGCSPYLKELGHYDFTGDGSGYTTEATDFSQAYCIDWIRLYQKDGCELFTK